MAILRSSQILHVDNYAGLPTVAQNNQLAMDDTSNNTYKYNATSAIWEPVSRTAVKKSSVSINAMVTGTTAIYTLEPSAMNFYPTEVIIRLKTKTGTIVTQPVISVGSNATSYNNIATGSLLTSVLAALSVGSGAPTQASVSTPLAGSTVIYANVTTAATGATVLTYTIDIVGYYDI